jgi:hypothetical protein
MADSVANIIAHEVYHARRLTDGIVDQMFTAAACHGLNSAALLCAVETALGKLTAWVADKDEDRLYRLVEALCDQLRGTAEAEFGNSEWTRQ